MQQRQQKAKKRLPWAAAVVLYSYVTNKQRALTYTHIHKVYCKKVALIKHLLLTFVVCRRELFDVDKAKKPKKNSSKCRQRLWKRCSILRGWRQRKSHSSSGRKAISWANELFVEVWLLCRSSNVFSLCVVKTLLTSLLLFFSYVYNIILHRICYEMYFQPYLEGNAYISREKMLGQRVLCFPYRDGLKFEECTATCGLLSSLFFLL